jgi:hypothetical protein
LSPLVYISTLLFAFTYERHLTTPLPHSPLFPPAPA